MQCIRCGAAMTAGSPCPVCGTRVIHVRDAPDPETSVRRLVPGEPPSVRRPARGLPRIHEGGRRPRLANARRPLIAAAVVAAVAAAVVVARIDRNDADGARTTDAAPVRTAVTAGGAGPGPVAPERSATSSPSGPAPAPAATPSIGEPSGELRTIRIPEAVAAIAAAAEGAVGDAVAAPAVPGAAPVVAAAECSIPACTPEGGAWTVADRARGLLKEDPGAAACWARESVRLGRRHEIPGIVASGYYHLGVALQLMGCRDRAHEAYLWAVCLGKRSTNPHLFRGYADACARTGDGCDHPCDNAARTADPAGP